MEKSKKAFGFRGRKDKHCRGISNHNTQFTEENNMTFDRSDFGATRSKKDRKNRPLTFGKRER